MSTIERTKEAVQAKKYSYEAIMAAALAFLPYLPDVINWLLSDPTAPAVPAEWKRYLSWAAFLLALYARSIVVRKPPEQDAVPSAPRPGEPLE